MLSAIGFPVSCLESPSPAGQQYGLLATWSDGQLNSPERGQVRKTNRWLISLFETQRQGLDLLLQVGTGQGYTTDGIISPTISLLSAGMALHSHMQGPSSTPPLWVCRCGHIFSLYTFTTFFTCPLPSFWPWSCLFHITTTDCDLQ